MTFLEYKKEAIKTRVGSADNEEYLTLGLLAEVGEVADKLAKRRRDGEFDDKAAMKELGDVLWYVAMAARKLGYTLEDVARVNNLKLRSRAERGELGGYGDER